LIVLYLKQLIPGLFSMVANPF